MAARCLIPESDTLDGKCCKLSILPFSLSKVINSNMREKWMDDQQQQQQQAMFGKMNADVWIVDR